VSTVKEIKTKFLDIFSFRKMCQQYKVEFWECPPFVFTAMGIVIIVAIVVSYFVGRVYVDPFVLVLLIIVMAVVLFILSYIIMNSFDRIARLAREKSEFISIMSHQLRNPLSSIKWQMDLLLNKEMGMAGERGREALSNIEEQNERMIRLVNDLLEISRFESGILVLKPVVFPFIGLVKEVISRYTDRAAFSKVEINFFPPEKNIEISADREKIKSAISHLLDNAIRYSPNGGRVNITLERKLNNLRFSIDDEGVGISRVDEKQIFRKFFRGASSKKYKSDGLGVGLFLVKAIVRASSGKTGFFSAEGKGSTFWFTLPLKS